MIRIAAEHEANAALLQAIGNRRNPLIEKTVMPQIGVRIKWHGSKKDNAWFAQQVCGVHCQLKSWIIERTLRPLHPVDNAGAVTIRFARPTDSDTRVRGQTIKFVHL